MRKRWIGLTVFVAAAALVAGGAYWLSRPDEVSAATPKGAPPVDSCWNVDEKAVADAFPWPGAPVQCTARHTAEVFLVGQVDRKLAAKAAKAKGDEARIEQTLMYGQARHACLAVAPTYLGGDWHASRVQVVASWVKPARTGFFGCAVVETAAPGGKRFVARTASLRGALSTGDLDISCVARGAGDEMLYTPCDQPHDGQFTGTYRITPPGAPFVANKVSEAVTTGCREAGGNYIGAARTDLRYAYVGPTSAGDWLGSDQTYACYALATDGRKLRGSLKGIGSGPLPH